MAWRLTMSNALATSRMTMCAVLKFSRWKRKSKSRRLMLIAHPSTGRNAHCLASICIVVKTRRARMEFKCRIKVALALNKRPGAPPHNIMMEKILSLTSSGTVRHCRGVMESGPGAVFNRGDLFHGERLPNRLQVLLKGSVNARGVIVWVTNNCSQYGTITSLDEARARRILCTHLEG